jgi:probable HAF family extracellular repeat protein
MKLIATLIAASALLGATGIAQSPHYTVVDLGAVGSPPGQPLFIAGNGLTAGAAAVGPGGPMHAALWYRAQRLDIGMPGLGGRNSMALGVNERGQVVGQAQTTAPDSEDFCGYNALGFPSPAACVPFVWQNGLMSRLPTLGGANGSAYSINNRGEVAGMAETARMDPTPGCPVRQFEPVIWRNGGIQPLATSGMDSHGQPFKDTDGVVAAINDNGQAVGASGSCAPFNTNSGLNLVENHALLWERDGSVTDLGNLGGIGGIAGNHGCAINNQGEVVGHSELLNNATFHGFLWTRRTGMKSLGVLPGDYASLGLGINDRSQVVGASLDASFTPRAILWQNGAMTDLNTPGVVTANPAGLYLLIAASINAVGEIVGLGVTADGLHGFLAIPNSDRDHSSNSERATRPFLSDSARRFLFHRLGLRKP